MSDSTTYQPPYDSKKLSHVWQWEATNFVGAFQKALGLKEDGKAGPDTYAALAKLFPDTTHREMSEREHFMVEAAMQHGFEPANDDATVFVASQEAIVSLMQSYRSSDEIAYAEMNLNDFIHAEIEKHVWPHGDGTLVSKEGAILAAQGAALQAIMDKRSLIDNLAVSVHAMNTKAGWWNDLKTGLDLHGKRNIGELLALKHSEISEAHDATDDLVPMLLDLQVLIAYAVAEQDDRKQRVLEIHSTLSRALEYYRKGNKPDDKLTHRPGFRVELIDCIIRALDTLGSDREGQRNHPAGTIFMEKIDFNRSRPDHQKAARLTHEGKTF